MEYLNNGIYTLFDKIAYLGHIIEWNIRNDGTHNDRADGYKWRLPKKYPGRGSQTIQVMDDQNSFILVLELPMVPATKTCRS